MITYDVHVPIGAESTEKNAPFVKCHDTGVNIRVFPEVVVEVSRWRKVVKPYQIPADGMAILKVTKPDGKWVAVESKEAGDCWMLFDLDVQALTVAGIDKAEVSIYNAEGKRLTTSTFFIEVPQEIVHDCEESSDNYADVVAEQIKNAAANAASEAVGDIPEFIKPLPVYEETRPTEKARIVRVDIEELDPSMLYGLADDGLNTLTYFDVRCDDGTVKQIAGYAGSHEFIIGLRIFNTKYIFENFVSNDRIIIDMSDKSTASNVKIENQFLYLDTDNVYEYIPTHDYNPATKKYVDDAIQPSVQPDWSQNDEAQPDYVKNRTHYTEILETNIEGMEFAFDTGRSNGSTDRYQYSNTHNLNIPFQLGQVWNVIRTNNVTIKNMQVRQSSDGTLYLGSEGLTDREFYITSNTVIVSKSWAEMWYVDSLRVVCVSGKITDTIVHQLDEKYIHDSVKNQALRVTITEIGEHLYSASHTYAQIEEAFLNGVCVTASMYKNMYALKSCRDGTAEFYAIYFDPYTVSFNILYINRDGSVTTGYLESVRRMGGAADSRDGASGLVPTPSAGDQNKFLRGDGTWAEAGGGGSGEWKYNKYIAITEDTEGFYIDSYDDGTPFDFTEIEVRACLKTTNTSGEWGDVSILHDGIGKNGNEGDSVRLGGTDSSVSVFVSSGQWYNCRIVGRVEKDAGVIGEIVRGGGGKYVNSPYHLSVQPIVQIPHFSYNTTAELNAWRVQPGKFTCVKSGMKIGANSTLWIRGR